MARALSTFSPFKTLLPDAISLLTQTRAFAAAAEAVRRSPKPDDKAAAAAQLLAGKRIARSADPHPWVPDPVTGCYRPANRIVELDAAELRAMLLTPKP